MRSRHVTKSSLHPSVQLDWQGYSTATGTTGYSSNMPYSNLEWGKYSSFTCRYFDDVVGVDFVSRQSHNELIVNPMQSVAWSLTNPLISYTSDSKRYLLAQDSDERVEVVNDYSFNNTWSSLTWSGVTYILGYAPPLSHDAAFGLFGRLVEATHHSSKVAQAISETENAATVRFRTDFADMVDVLLSDRDAFYLLPGLLKAICKLTSDFESKRISASALDISRLWLAYRYGVRPLVYDISVILRQLHKKGAVRRSFRSRSDVIESELSHSEIRYGLAQYSGFTPNKAYCSSIIKLKSRIRAGITADLTLEELSETGYRFDRLLPTVWDLTPYSFLVDWFLNVSDWLTNFAPTPKVSQQVGFVTHSCNISVQGSSIAANQPSQYPMRALASYYRNEYRCESNVLQDKGYLLTGLFKSREAFTPAVHLTFDPISWISGSHVADLLAIIMGLKSVRTSLRRLPTR